MNITNGFVKKFICGTLISAMIIGLTACGSGGANAEDALKQAQEAMASIKSLSYDMEMDVEMSAQGKEVKMDTETKADYIVDPMQMKLELDMDVEGQSSMKSSIYVVQENGQYTVCTGTDLGSGSMHWSKQSVADISIYAQYNAKEKFELYLSSIDNLKEKDSEKVDDKDAVRYEGMIAKDSLVKVLGSSGAFSSFQTLGITESHIESVLDDLGDLSINIWLDKKDNMPLKYEIDITEIMEKLIDSIMGESNQQDGFKISKITESVTISDTNSIEKIEIPAEAQAV
ncbi:MAG: hypothetical protein HFE90_10175 [Firmicutes bacterium]|nr:hypothetical protein [Bacillota bacterium]